MESGGKRRKNMIVSVRKAGTQPDEAIKLSHYKVKYASIFWGSLVFCEDELVLRETMNTPPGKSVRVAAEADAGFQAGKF